MRWLLVALLVGCGGKVAPVAQLEPVDGGVCDARTLDAWCWLLARGGYDVDPNAGVCCTRWIEDSDR